MNRHEHNIAMLRNVHPQMARKIQAVLKDLEGHGFRPKIYSAYRSPEEQAEKVRKGYSKVSFSFHNAVRWVNGKRVPSALACDIADERWGWSRPEGEAARLWDRFWITLGRSGHVHGLEWGGYWGLSAVDRAKLKAAITLRNFGFGGRLGWDIAHLQLLPNSMLAQVRRGYVPPLS
jgi:hypothetical protein